MIQYILRTKLQNYGSDTKEMVLFLEKIAHHIFCACQE